MSTNEKNKALEERTAKFAKNFILFSKEISYNQINRNLIFQGGKSTSSVGANYREANEALSKKDFIYRIKICRKEAKESIYWMDLIRAANSSSNNQAEILEDEATQLAKIFSSIIKNVENQ